MSCGQYEEWLFLHRPGELSRADLAALEAHLRDCPQCAALKKALASDDRRLARLRAMAPEPPDADAAAGRVLLAIGGRKPVASHSRIRNFLEVILLTFNQPRIRTASAFLSVTLVGALLYQQFSVMSEVSNLEARMALRQDQPGMIHTAFVLDAEAVSRIPRSSEILEALGDRVKADSDRNIIISREAAQSMQETATRTLRFTSRKAGSAVLDARVIEEISRVVQRQASLVFRVSRKGGAG